MSSVQLYALTYLSSARGQLCAPEALGHKVKVVSEGDSCVKSVTDWARLRSIRMAVSRIDFEILICFVVWPQFEDLCCWIRHTKPLWARDSSANKFVLSENGEWPRIGLKVQMLG